MTIYYLDASAWVKRYVQEAGSEWMGHFWAERPSLACSTIGALEVFAAILRRARPEQVSEQSLRRLIDADAQGFHEVCLSPEVFSKARELIGRHRLRCADAIHLASAFLAGEELNASVCVVASDAELLSAASSEGFTVLDPQTDPPLIAQAAD